MSELQIELETAEKKVSDFTAQTQLVSIEGLQALERQIKELRYRIDGAATAQAETETRLDNLKSAATPEKKLEIAQDPTLVRIASGGLDSQGERDSFDARYEAIKVKI